jgi:hypothetical protein
MLVEKPEQTQENGQKASFQEICHLQHVYNQMRFSGKSCKNDLLGHPGMCLLVCFANVSFIFGQILN